MDDGLRRQWRDLLSAWAVDLTLTDQTFEHVCRQYAGPGRFYHTLGHIQDVLATAASVAAHARSLKAVQLAAWLHDVIYNSRASDNEESSAAYAVRLCERLSIPESRLVASLILTTKTHDAGDDPDAQVLLDADLAILGASASVYQTYAERVRLEYAWVPEAAYRTTRRQVLDRFLTRPKIFHILRHLEEPARCNIADEMAQLADA
jgi:predicted metal-dependent HD superfamily phosphohydrolase